jgi:ketosteroid isomerase-like protein
MEDLVGKVKDMYAAFGRGDVETILNSTTEDVSWEFEAPAALSWSGIRKGRKEAMGFFVGIATEQENPVLKVTDYFTTDGAVAAFGRYDATVKATGVRVSTPVAHYFKFRDRGISTSLTREHFWRRRRGRLASGAGKGQRPKPGWGHSFSKAVHWSFARRADFSPLRYLPGREPNL